MVFEIERTKKAGPKTWCNHCVDDVREGTLVFIGSQADGEYGWCLCLKCLISLRDHIDDKIRENYQPPFDNRKRFETQTKRIKSP